MYVVYNKAHCVANDNNQEGSKGLKKTGFCFKLTVVYDEVTKSMSILRSHRICNQVKIHIYNGFKADMHKLM